MDTSIQVESLLKVRERFPNEPDCHNGSQKERRAWDGGGLGRISDALMSLVQRCDRFAIDEPNRPVQAIADLGISGDPEGR